MQSGAKPETTDDRRDFVVIPSDQVRVAPSDAEITDLLRAAARQHSEAEVRAALEAEAGASVPPVDTTFRATAVSDDVPGRKGSFGRRARRAFAAFLLALGIGGVALTWQTFGYAAKKAVVSWAPKWAIASSIPLDKLGFGPQSRPSDTPPDAAPTQAGAPNENAADSAASDSAAANAPAPSPDSTQQLQSMARDLANANQEIEALKASITELKASQQQMARDLAKASDKLAEQGAKAKMVAAAPRPVAVHKPTPAYSPTATYSPSPAAAPPSAYRPTPSSYSAQASVAPPPPATQSTVPAPIPLRPQADSEAASAPRPPMPVQ